MSMEMNSSDFADCIGEDQDNGASSSGGSGEESGRADCIGEDQDNGASSSGGSGEESGRADCIGEEQDNGASSSGRSGEESGRAYNGRSDGPLSCASEIEDLLEVGSSLQSLDEIYVLYCEYARHVGFSVKKGTQRYFGAFTRDPSDIRKKVFLCSCEGYPDNRRIRDTVPCYRKHVRRTDCKARLRVVRDSLDAPWFVSCFHKEHNHELVPPEQTYLLRSARNLSLDRISILESMKKAGIRVSDSCRFMENEAAGRENIGFTRKDAYNHLNRIRRVSMVDNGDANALLRYFVDKSNKEPLFYWNVQSDDDGRLMNFFFRDARSLVDYQYFGDVMSCDTTFRTNKYNLICAPFVGMNHHQHNVMFGMGFLSDETTKSFEWLFSCFLESMDSLEPQVIFSDQSQALINGIEYSFKTAKHRLCQWHINRNAPKHFGSLNGKREFKRSWYYCMNKCETEEEFESCWKSLIETYGLGDHGWFHTMYNMRSKWSTAYTNTMFCGGLRATSRSESTNRAIKSLISGTSSLHEFVVLFEQLQNDWRSREGAEDALCIGMPGQLIEGNYLLTQAAKLLTRNVYKLFEKGAQYSINVQIIQEPSDYNAETLEFKVRTCNSVRELSFYKSTEFCACSCRRWETEGVVCTHIWRILFHMNVSVLCDRFILKRWTRAAKLRDVNAVNSCSRTPWSRDNPVDDMVFVRNFMRQSYELALTYRKEVRSRVIMNRTLNDLMNKLMKGRAGPSTTGEADPMDAFTGMRFFNPPAATHRTYPGKRNPTNDCANEDDNDNEGETAPVRRKRGRPRGSKNLKGTSRSRLGNKRMMNNSQSNTNASLNLEENGNPDSSPLTMEDDPRLSQQIWSLTDVSNI